MVSGEKKDGRKQKGLLVENLSRSKLELFLECPRCFYADRVLGVPRPDEHSYALNLAVDALFKKEFDAYRNKGEPHPLMRQQEIDAVPFFHPALNDWREAARGIRILHEESAFVVHGAVDDVWEETSGKLAIVDYKCTGRVMGPMDSARPGYRRQVEVYQWILRRMGFRVSRNAYFVFAAPDRNRPAFEDVLHFTTTIVRHVGDDSWVADALLEARHCLELRRLPASSAECPWCAFVTARTGAVE
jgi:RecB family exonuclease